MKSLNNGVGKTLELFSLSVIGLARCYLCSLWQVATTMFWVLVDSDSGTLSTTRRVVADLLRLAFNYNINAASGLTNLILLSKSIKRANKNTGLLSTPIVCNAVMNYFF